MKILIRTDPGLGDDSGVPVSRIATTAERQGFHCLTMPVHDASLTKVMPAASLLDASLETGIKPHERTARSAVEEFRPNVLLVQASVAKLGKVESLIARSLHGFLQAYSLHLAPDGRLHLKNQSTGKIFKLAVDDTEKLVNIMRSETVSACRVPQDFIDGHSPGFDDLARAEISLRQYGAVLPYRARELRQEPKRSFNGALETIANEDIILDDEIWLKGWIDWDEKAYSKLIVQLYDREYEIELGAFRADRHDPKACRNPLSFSTRIELGNLFSFNTLTLYVETSQGIRFEWLSRKIWISRDTSTHSQTPLITGEARLTGDGWVAFSANTDGPAIERILAWQDGTCVGRWDASTASTQQTPAFRIFPTDETIGLIHLHLHLSSGCSVPWLTLSQQTDELASFAEMDNVSTVENDSFSLEIEGADCDFPVSVFLDGKLHSVVSQPAHLEIDISRCAGRAILQTLDRRGGRRAILLWRHCRDAASGRMLPAFVLPPRISTRQQHGPENGLPRLLLIRQAAAPTDELYLLSALEKIRDTSDFSLEIVNLAEEETSEADMDRLLAEGVSVIVSRYLTTPWIDAVSRRRARLRDVFYIMDDDVTLAQNDIRMPGGYRKRMIGVAHSEFQTLLHLSTRFLVTSQFLYDRFRSKKTDLITPPYIRPATSLAHLDDMSEIRIEYHGTQVHRVDLDAIASALIWIHDKYPHVKIRTYMGKFAPLAFKGYERIEIVPDIPWEDYKAAVAASPAHIALAPMLESPYNKGKSFVKVMDIARLGALGVYTRRAPYSDVIRHGVDGLLLENDALIWRYALSWLVENPEEIRRMALAAQKRTLELGDIDILVRYWTETLFSGTTLQDAALANLNAMPQT